MTSALRTDESGFGLIEVLVSALLVALVAVGALTALDGASAATGRNKERSAAQTLAQQEQELLRGMQISKLSNLRRTRDVTVCDGGRAACPTYRISSRADWRPDGTTSGSCTTSSTEVGVLRLQATVWPLKYGTTSTAAEAAGFKPVTSESLIAPPLGSLDATRGSISFKVVGADGVTGVPGLSVTLSGGPAGFTSMTDTTNAAGCVVWGYLDPGSGATAYTVSTSAPGYTTPNGQTSISTAATVTAQQITSLSYQYARAASARATFYAPGLANAPVQVDRVTFLHANTSNPGFGGTGTVASQIDGTGLFPYHTTAVGPDSWRVYAGDCDAEDPVKQTPAQPATSVELNDGAVNAPVSIPVPAYDVNVSVSGTGPPSASSPKVMLTTTAPGCAATNWPLVDVATSGALAGHAQGAVPFGTYDVCAQATIGGTTWRTVVSGKTLTSIPSPAAPTSLGTIDVKNGSPSVQKACGAP